MVSMVLGMLSMFNIKDSCIYFLQFETILSKLVCTHSFITSAPSLHLSASFDRKNSPQFYFATLEWIFVEQTVPSLNWTHKRICFIRLKLAYINKVVLSWAICVVVVVVFIVVVDMNVFKQCCTISTGCNQIYWNELHSCPWLKHMMNGHFR